MEALKQPTLGSPEPPWAHLQEKCGPSVGSRPESWAWPTPKKYPELKLKICRSSEKRKIMALKSAHLKPSAAEEAKPIKSKKGSSKEEC